MSENQGRLWRWNALISTPLTKKYEWAKGEQRAILENYQPSHFKSERTAGNLRAKEKVTQVIHPTACRFSFWILKQHQILASVCEAQNNFL